MNEKATFDQAGEHPLKDKVEAMDEIEKIIQEFGKKTKITEAEYNETMKKMGEILRESEGIDEKVVKMYEERFRKIFKSRQETI